MKKSLFLLTAVAVTLFSCEKEQDFITENPDLSGKTVTVKASHEVDAEVKTTVDGLGNVEWETTDKLSFVYDGGSAESNAAGVTGTSAEFTATLPGGKEALYLVYPSSVTAEYESSSLKVTVPATQDGTFASAAIEVAQFAASCDLKNLGAILAITTTADVDEIVISSNNSTPLAGKATVAFAAGIPSVDAVASGSTSVTLSGLGGAGTYYAAVLPDSYAAGIYVELKKSGSVVGEKISGNALTVARRKIMRINVGNPGTIGNKKFVTVSGAGAKDGSSWDNALDAAGFYSFLTSASTNVNVFMAAGTYTTTAENGVTMSALVTGLKVYGGYRTDLAGSSLAGRDISTYHTILSGGGTNRILVLFKSGITATFDGLEFKNAYRAEGKKDIGSAICAQALSSANFYNCTISDNENAGVATSSGGGAVRAAAGSVLFKGCLFKDNTSSYNGGAMRVNGSTVTLDACTFETNSAVNGGSVYLSAGTLIIRSGSCLNNNEASERGGSIYMSDGTLTISDSQFNLNNADLVGGAIAVVCSSACSINVSGTNFYHNRAAQSGNYCGGALYVAGAESKEADVSMTDCYFEENEGHPTDVVYDPLDITSLKNGITDSNAATGGAIFNLQYATVKLNRCRFYHNLCGQNGGAIRVKEATAKLYMNACVFDRNYSGKGPSAIMNTSGKVAMNNCVFYSNQMKTGSTGASTFTCNSAGAECLIINTSMTVNSSYRAVNLLNTSTNSVLVNNIFKNSSSDKSAVDIASGKTVSSFGHNIWSVLGGAGTVDDTHNSPSTDVVATITWTWSDPNLVVSSLPTAYYESGVVDNRAALSELTAAVTYFDEQNSTAFGTWLSSIAEGGRNPLNVDVRGYLRPSKIWPGSYQKDATK